VIFDFDYKSFFVDDFDCDFKIILRLMYDFNSNIATKFIYLSYLSTIHFYTVFYPLSKISVNGVVFTTKCPRETPLFWIYRNFLTTQYMITPRAKKQLDSLSRFDL